MSTSASSPESESEDFERLLRLAQVGLSSRAEAWPALLGVPALRQTEPPDYFRDLLELATSGETSGETTASDLAFETRQIWLDLSRTGHPRFNRSADRTDLASVLLAYARRCPAYGWHPWRVLLAARLLLVGCDRETAFWCLVAVVEQLPGAAHLVGLRDPNDYDDDAYDIQHEGLALMRLLRLATPEVATLAVALALAQTQTQTQDQTQTQTRTLSSTLVCLNPNPHQVATVLDRLDTSGAGGRDVYSRSATMLGRARRHLLFSPTAEVDSEVRAL